jgi:membrane protein
VAEPTPAEWVRREGGSAALIKWMRRVEAHLPRLAPTIGFWAVVYARFARHRGPVLAGGLAFFALLSIVPAVVSLAALATLLLGSSEFIADLEALLGKDGEVVGWMRAVVSSAAEARATDLRTLGVAGLISLAVSLYAASRFVYVARLVLDISFEQEPEPPSVLWRVMAVLVTLAVQVAIVLLVAVLAIVPRLLDRLGLESVYLTVVQVARLPLMVALVYFLLTVGMRYSTRARPAVGWANAGALVGTLVIALGTAGLGWYLSVSVTFSQLLATLGGVIALELWLFVVCMGVVVSAETEGVRQGFSRRDVRPGT